MHTICPECDGRGRIYVERAVISLSQNRSGNAMVLERCRACDGEGRRDGFQAPV